MDDIINKEDDFSHEESNSITMQRILLSDYVREHFPQDTVMEYSDMYNQRLIQWLSHGSVEKWLK